MSNRRFIRLWLLPFISACGCTCERCDPPPPQACFEYEAQRAVALKAKDWKNLKEIAQNFTATCSGAATREDLAKAYVDLSAVFRNRYTASTALEYVDYAVKLSAQPEPHIERALVLSRLNRRDEAIIELDTAKSMASTALKQLEFQATSKMSDLKVKDKIGIYKNILVEIEERRQEILIKNRRQN